MIDDKNNQETRTFCTCCGWLNNNEHPALDYIYAQIFSQGFKVTYTE